MKKRVVSAILVAAISLVGFLPNLNPDSSAINDNVNAFENADTEQIVTVSETSEQTEAVEAETASEIVTGYDEVDSVAVSVASADLSIDENYMGESYDESTRADEENALFYVNIGNEELPVTEADLGDPLYYNYFDEEGNSIAAANTSVESTVSAEGARTNENIVLGMDVSKWQGTINWTTAKNAGVQYVFVRVAYRQADGQIYDDPYYARNISGALAAGLKVGAYFYSDATTEEAAIEEANYLMARVCNYNITLPLVIDYENFGANKSAYQVFQGVQNGTLTKESMTNIVSAFCNRVAQCGYTPCVYASANYLKNYMDGNALASRYNVWAAAYSYPPEHYNNIPYDFWQFTSSENGPYYGVSSATIDLDYWYTGSYLAAPGVTVSYQTHVQDYGTMPTVINGYTAGVTGQAKRMEALWIGVDGNPNLGISYTTHVQDYGWLPNTSAGQMSGTSGESKRVEALMIKLTGSDAENYDIYYRTHVQDYGWLNWACNGAPSGSAGLGKRIEAIQIIIVQKGTTMPQSYLGATSVYRDAFVSSSAAPNMTDYCLSYATHVQDYGWQSARTNGGFSGTSGKAKRLEGITIALNGAPYAGGIQYRTHVQNIGWQDWVANGAMSGTTGQSLRLEAIQIQLTGEMAEHYDIYYRVHAQNIGWMGWACNGEQAGTAGYSYRLEGIQIVIVPKGSGAPSTYYNGINQDNAQVFISR